MKFSSVLLNELYGELNQELRLLHEQYEIHKQLIGTAQHSAELESED